MADKPIFSLEIPPELYEKAKTEAERLGISLAGFIRQLLVNYFDKR
jgi:hypothetical protein